MNVSDLLIKSEEESRKCRDRGEDFRISKIESESEQKATTRDSVVEFPPDQSSHNRASKVLKKKSKRKISKK